MPWFGGFLKNFFLDNFKCVFYYFVIKYFYEFINFNIFKRYKFFLNLILK